MTKIIVLIVALVAASSMPSFAQTAEPPAHKTGIVDTLLEHADATRCAVARDDIPDEVLLSSCNQQQPIVTSTAAGKCFLDSSGRSPSSRPTSNGLLERRIRKRGRSVWRSSRDCSKIGRAGFGAVGSVRQAQGRHQRVRWPVLPAAKRSER
jgi:hypothetical protein